MATVELEMHGNVALVRLNAPPVNAVSTTMMEEMIVMFDRLSEHPGARAIILTGAGKVFSAGADIKQRVGRGNAPGLGWGVARLAREMGYALMECRKPIIAAVNGPALGAGLGIVASCDILMASHNASVGLPEIDVGMMGGGRHAMRIFGHSLTRRMMFSGDRITAAELYRRGLLEQCVPLPELLPEALRLAERIAAKSPLASSLVKHTIGTIESMGLRDGFRYEQNMTADLNRTSDAGEAMRAFLEKRAPAFTGQ